MNTAFTKDELLDFARLDWHRDYKRTEEEYQKAQMECQKIQLKIRAYENKLKRSIDPDGKEWENTWKILQDLKEDYHKNYIDINGQFVGQYNRIWWNWFKAKKRHESRYGGFEEWYFKEWLAGQGIDPEDLN